MKEKGVFFMSNFVKKAPNYSNACLFGAFAGKIFNDFKVARLFRADGIIFH